MAVVETSFSLSRWDYHLNRILNIWVHFIEQIEIFAFKKINFHLINAITTESSKHNHPALSSVKCPNYKECKKCVPQRELDCWDGHCVCCEVFIDKPLPNRSMARPCTR